MPNPRRRALLLHNPHLRRGAEALGVALAHLGDAGIEVAAESYRDPGEVSPDIVRRGGALLYALKPAAYDINHDLAIGPDNILYRLEGKEAEPVRSYRVVPHIP